MTKKKTAKKKSVKKKTSKKKTTKKKTPSKKETSAPQKKRAVYEFPKEPCDRCGSFNTHAVSTQENIQYRQCDHPICRNNFKVIGIKKGTKD